MKVEVGGKIEPSEKVTFRRLGFGRPVPGKELYTVIIRLTLNELQEVVSEEFDRFSRESKEDDESYGGETVVVPLRSLDYPTLSSALERNQGIVEEVLMQYIFLEFLEGIFGENDEARCLYSVNSLENITIAEDHVTIAGFAYKIA